MNRISSMFLLGILLIWIASGPAQAGRHLVSVAAHLGQASEEPLRHAARDARRIQQVFSDLEGVGIRSPTSCPNSWRGR